MQIRPLRLMLNFRYIKIPFPKNNQGPSTSSTNPKPSNNSQNNNTNNVSYKNVPYKYDNIITYITQGESRVSMIQVKGKDPQCAITKWCTHISLLGPSTSSQPAPVSSKYNILDHLGKTPAQISILDLLKFSPIHQEILTKSLHDRHVSNNIDPTKFQALVGHFLATYQLGFNLNNMPLIDPSHNCALDIEVLVTHHKEK